MSTDNFVSNSFFAKITHLIYYQREYNNFKQILSEIAQEAQTILKVDRIKIYQFAADGSGEVIAEAVEINRLPSLLGLHFPDTDIPTHARESLAKFNKGVIVDVTAKRKTVYIESNLRTNFKEKTVYQTVDPCHLQYLLTMGVLSSLVIPIFYWDSLWGFLVAHHSEPRRFTEQELVLMQLLSKQVSLALNQEALINQYQYEQKQQNIINKINQVWWNNHHNQQQAWLEILARIVQELNTEQGLVYIAPELTGKPGQIYYHGQKSDYPNLANNQQWINLNKTISTLTDTPYYPQAYTRQELLAQFDCEQLLEQFSQEIHSFLFINLHHHYQWIGCVTLLRKEQEWEVLWAGKQDYDSRNQRPRESFATWCEKKRGSPYWSSNELKLAEKIGKYLYNLLTQQRINNLINHQVNYDNLTKLPNQQIFTEQLNFFLVQTIETGQMLGLVMLDLDQFKRINESLGHTVGDFVLKQVATRIKDYLETQPSLKPLLARWHGDRFVILVHKLNYIDELISLSEKILEQFNNPFYYQNYLIDLSASLGITIAPYDGDNAETLIKNAEIAMYQAKTQGKNTFEIYSPKQEQQDLNWLTMAADLKRAIHREELTLYYQPQVCLKTRKITGVEALTRWFHPQYGLISPTKFIPLAEEIGVIHELGEWVLKTACEQFHFWEIAGFHQVRMSVNLSPIQFQKSNLLNRIESILAETQMNTEYLELEINESTLVQNFQQTIEILEVLKKQGVRIAIDDFGTGYSSLSILKHLPVNIIKIDQSFIKNIIEDNSAARLCQSIILLGKSLNLRVIAEGVETTLEADLLEQLGCDEIQGYLMSPPVDAASLTEMLSNTLPRGEIVKITSPNPHLSLNIPVDLSDHKIIKELAVNNQDLIDAYQSLKQQLKYQNIRENMVMEVAQKIRQSLRLEDILEITVIEVRHLLNVDRVFLYQFDANWAGTVVVESVSDQEYSILGEWIDEPCFREKYVKYYRQGRVKAIEDITKEGLETCHFDLLERYQVKSNLVLPIVHQEKLWGLLIAHQCREIRQWENQEVRLLSQLATQIAIAIHQGELYEELQCMNFKLQKLSIIDGLTQVANRRRFDEYLQEQWYRLMGSEDELSVILCDVDFFKQYNDTYGHQAGDQCLQAIAQTLSENLKRPDDLVARYGGGRIRLDSPQYIFTRKF